MSSNLAESQVPGPSDDQRLIDQGGNQYLTFMLAGEEYAMDILRVQEIKGLENVTEIPNTPEYVLGVINLRGTVIPVIDMRLRFDMEPLEYTQLTVVIVVRVFSEESERTIGFVVDTVSDVYNILPNEVGAPPDFGSGIDTAFVSGIASVEEKMIIVLDADEVAANFQGML